ncbi:SCO6880 family protein [Streptomyces sp. NBC_01445]|uniref:SCO6880 family protein n=1 Tax=Streptomyces sp. NBC_01445 TaxID=2903869 RepID=UPI002DDBBCC8|nr:SCO6880 family protein [Streptomyces sp. NBC_01445]WSE08927.1 type VII secretion protein EccE [Streptomyces sp. NBC_01445]
MHSGSPHPDGPVTVKFPHRSRRGVLLGLSAPQLIVVAVTGLLLLAVLLSAGVTGALNLIPLWALVLAAVFMRHRGRSLADWAPIVFRYALRRFRGQLIWLTRPSTRPQREGLLHLPGTAASLRVATSPDGRFGAVHDPHEGTLTAVVKVSSRAFALLDPATQTSNVSGWGRTLAALARTGHIARVQVLERTVPDSGDALHRYWNQHGDTHSPLAGPIYRDLLAAAGPAAAPHEAYVALALDLKAARRLINQAGGGLTGGFAVLAQLTSTFDQAARNSGLMPSNWLTATEIAAVIRTAYDPKASAALDQWSASGHPQADPAAAGPVVLVEKADRIHTDSAHHATFWIENWPRIETSPGFLHQLLFTSGVRRTLSLTYEPKGLDSALKDVQRKKATVIADAAERARKGQVDSEEDSVEYADIKQRERQLIAGHADVALTGLLTVSADSDEQLNAACAAIETAAVAALIDLRPLTWQQAEAFTNAALPLARP